MASLCHVGIIFLYFHCFILSSIGLCNAEEPPTNLNLLGNITWTLQNVLGFTVGTANVVVNDALRLDPTLKNNFNDPDFDKNITELIEGLGYPVEEHTVQTTDGYILGLYRIPYGVGNNALKNKPVVLMVHGLLGSCSDFVINASPDQNLANILADNGYDVWLLNYRGNIYSEKNIKFNKTDPEFWKFTWDEMGLIDLPTVIDFILSQTGKAKLSIVGYSMGTTTSFALLSTKTEYNAKVNVLIALAPVTKVKNAFAPIVGLFQLSGILPFLTSLGGTTGHFPASSEQSKGFNKYVCGIGLINRFCGTITEIEMGPETDHINKTRLPVYNNHYPAGTSTYTINHFAQSIYSDLFQMYDFGKEENLKRYKQDSPPLYLTEKITVPVVLISSLSDGLADQKDIDLLRKTLPNLKLDKIVDAEDYNHGDFAVAIDANKYVYSIVLDQIKRFQQ